MKQKKVLIIEDHPGMLATLRIRLKHEGLDIVTARSEQEALRLVETERPDISLLDSYLTITDADAFLEKLRGAARRQVVVFSFRGEPGEAVLERKADVFIPIPFDVDRIARQLRKLCGLERPQIP